MKCISCNEEQPHHAKGLCRRCYSREQGRRLYKENPDRYKITSSKWYHAHKDNVKAYRKKNIDNIRIYRRAYENKIRLDVLDLLGRKCVRCGFDDWQGLQIDHINGGGSKEMRLFKRPKTMYKYYLDHPEEAKAKLQTLCANCNQIKKYQQDECRK